MNPRPKATINGVPSGGPNERLMDQIPPELFACFGPLARLEALGFTTVIDWNASPGRSNLIVERSGRTLRLDGIANQDLATIINRAIDDA